MNWLKQLNAYLQKLRLKYIFILYITLYKDYIARHEIHFDPQSMIDATLRITLTWNSLLSRANFADMLFEDKFWIIFNNCDNWCRHYVVETTFIIANNKKKKKRRGFLKSLNDIMRITLITIVYVAAVLRCGSFFVPREESLDAFLRGVSLFSTKRFYFLFSMELYCLCSKSIHPSRLFLYLWIFANVKINIRVKRKEIVRIKKTLLLTFQILELKILFEMNVFFHWICKLRSGRK